MLGEKGFREDERVERLKKEIENLRISRRVLMYLVERIEQERIHLEVENQRLQKNNSKYARTIIDKNNEIIKLQSKLK